MQLAEYYSANGPERVGVVYTDGTVRELENKAEQPFRTFKADPSFLIAEEQDIHATWHTHPGRNANLSVADYETFLAWPQFQHYIVGKDSVLRFYVENNRVHIADETDPARLSG